MHSVYDLPAAEIQDDEKDTLFEPGDAALILKRDGRIVPISSGFGEIGEIMAAIGTRPLTLDEQSLLEQGNRLFALLVACQSPVIMTILYELSENPEIFDEGAIERLERLKRPN